MADLKDVHIIVAEDDDDDFFMTVDALKAAKVANNIHRVVNGEELLDFLNSKKIQGSMLILLDLNMPKMDGREALRKIKENPDFKRIPITVLTTSQSDEDIIKSYDLGVNSFIKKPVDFEEFIEAIRAFQKYWIQVVELPKL